MSHDDAVDRIRARWDAGALRLRKYSPAGPRSTKLPFHEQKLNDVMVATSLNWRPDWVAILARAGSLGTSSEEVVERILEEDTRDYFVRLATGAGVGEHVARAAAVERVILTAKRA